MITTSKVNWGRSLQEMAAPRRAVRQSKNCVKMKTNLVILVAPDIAENAQYLALFVDWNAAVVLRVEIEPADRRTLKRADGGDRRADNVLVGGQSLNGAERLFTGIENDSKKPGALTVAQ